MVKYFFKIIGQSNLGLTHAIFSEFLIDFHIQHLHGIQL